MIIENTNMVTMLVGPIEEVSRFTSRNQKLLEGHSLLPLGSLKTAAKRLTKEKAGLILIYVQELSEKHANLIKTIVIKNMDVPIIAVVPGEDPDLVRRVFRCNVFDVVFDKGEQESSYLNESINRAIAFSSLHQTRGMPEPKPETVVEPEIPPGETSLKQNPKSRLKPEPSSPFMWLFRNAHKALCITWQKLTHPSPFIKDTEIRHQAKLLSSILVFLIPLFSIGVYFNIRANRGFLYGMLFISVWIMLVLSYVVSRTRHYYWAAFLSVIPLSVLPYVPQFLMKNHSDQRFIIAMIWVMFAILLGSLILKLRQLLLLVAFHLISMASLLFFRPEINPMHLLKPWSFILCMSTLILVEARLRRQAFKDLLDKSNQLSESERRYHSLFDATFEAIIVLDGNLIVDANHAFEKLFGYPLTQVIGSDLAEYLDKQKFPGQLDDLGEAHLRGRHKDGSFIELEVTTRPHIYRGRTTTVAALRDVTVRKEMEQKLRDKNHELTDFTYVVSHDLKNPLNIIKGYLSAIAADQKLFARYYQKVINQADGLLVFIDSLLKLSRAGRVLDHRQPVDVAKMVRMNFAVSRPDKLKASLDVNPHTPGITGDPVRLGQVISNLVLNSINFQDPKKEHLQIKLSGRQEADRIIYTYSDNGIGIAPDRLDRIFESGFTTRRGSGSGFGLAIAKKIMLAHGGGIFARSEGPGQGAEFTFWFPAEDCNVDKNDDQEQSGKKKLHKADSE